MDNSDHITILSGLVNAFLPYKNETERLALVVNLNTSFKDVPPDMLAKTVEQLRREEDRMPTEKRILEVVRGVVYREGEKINNKAAWGGLVTELARLRLESCFEPGAWFDLARRMDSAGMVHSAAEVRARGNWLIDLGGQHA